MVDWDIFSERHEFRRAKQNKLHRQQLHRYFSVIASYRDSTYHHASDGGAAAAVDRIRRIIDVPLEYKKFLGPRVPIIKKKEVEREIAVRIHSEMPQRLKKVTSIQLLRYLAKRYPIEVMRKALDAPEKAERTQSIPLEVELAYRELEQFRTPGLKSVYAKRLKQIVLAEAGLTWV